MSRVDIQPIVPFKDLFQAGATVYKRIARKKMNEAYGLIVGYGGMGIFASGFGKLFYELAQYTPDVPEKIFANFGALFGLAAGITGGLGGSISALATARNAFKNKQHADSLRASDSQVDVQHIDYNLRHQVAQIALENFLTTQRKERITELLEILDVPSSTSSAINEAFNLNPNLTSQVRSTDQLSYETYRRSVLPPEWNYPESVILDTSVLALNKRGRVLGYLASPDNLSPAIWTFGSEFRGTTKLRHRQYLGSDSEEVEVFSNQIAQRSFTRVSKPEYTILLSSEEPILNRKRTIQLTPTMLTFVFSPSYLTQLTGLPSK